MPRFGVAYDVFGNGKTAAKFFLGKYVTTSNTVDEWLNYSPAGLGHFVSTDMNRGWETDGNGRSTSRSTRNCLNPAANGECGAGECELRASKSPPLTVDPATTDGWNTREHSWDLNARACRRNSPRVSVEVELHPAELGKHAGHDQPRLTPADFDPFVYNVPSDPRLPGGGGYPLTFYDINPAKFQQLDNFLTLRRRRRRRHQHLQRRRHDGERTAA